MGIEENKEVIEGIFSGKSSPMDDFAEDGVWVINGSRSFHGKKQIQDELLSPIMGLLESMGRMVITNMVAEGDQVVVEAFAEGRVTKTGIPYNNTYCIVYKFDNGKIVRLTEYCDTALAKKAFPELAL